jgi:hypothetical protein
MSLVVADERGQKVAMMARVQGQTWVSRMEFRNLVGIDPVPFMPEIVILVDPSLSK